MNYFERQEKLGRVIKWHWHIIIFALLYFGYRVFKTENYRAPTIYKGKGELR